MYGRHPASCSLSADTGARYASVVPMVTTLRPSTLAVEA